MRILLLLLGAVLTACFPAAQAQSGKGVTILRFVTYAKERPAEEFRKMEPFQRHLETLLVERGFRVKVDLHIFATYEEAHDAIAAGQFDFGRLGPASYVLVKARNPAVRPLVSESYRGTTRFEGSLFVLEDSKIRTVADIRGKRVAFGDDKSTTGRFLPQAVLVQAGITGKNLSAFAYLDRHDKVITAVAAENFDVGAANDRTLEKFPEYRFRKIARLVSPTEPWIYNARLDPKLVDALRDALLKVDMKALKYLDRDGFLPIRESDFNELAEQMMLSAQFAN